MQDLKGLGKDLRTHSKQIARHIRNALPRKVGVLATNHFRDNFRQGGFVNAGLQPWVPAQRQGRAKGALGQYGPLLSKRTHLMRSIRSEPGDARVKIINDVPYARIHNEGFSGRVQVPEHLRRTKPRSLTGAREDKTAKPSIQTVKAHTKQMRMIQRQYMGEARELNELIRNRLLAYIESKTNQ